MVLICFWIPIGIKIVICGYFWKYEFVKLIHVLYLFVIHRNQTRNVTPPNVIVNPSPTGQPFMTLVCDCIILFSFLM